MVGTASWSQTTYYLWVIDAWKKNAPEGAHLPNQWRKAQLVKRMVARGLALAACKQLAGELFAVVSQNFRILIG